MSRNSRGTFGSSLSRFVIVISAVGIGLRLMTKGLMSPERLMVFLILVVVAAVIDSPWTRSILAVFALGFFVLDYVDYDMRAFYSNIGPVFALVIALFGFFVMFGGFRRGK
ncbi:MAG: hypothetical protein IPL32_03620 [Chloracidobacterium sp.]|nr:hypothetical protein [Chloracidobacterium sp.]